MSYKFSVFEKNLLKRAKQNISTIVLPEADMDERVRQAGEYVAKHKIARVVFLTNGKSAHVDTEYLRYVDIHDKVLCEGLADALYVARKEKGLTKKEAKNLVKDPVYFGTMMLHLNMVDGLVCGACHSTADSIRPALQVIKSKHGIVSSFMLLDTPTKYGDNGLVMLSDCAINVAPTPEQLVSITQDTAKSYIDVVKKSPRVAILSYSTKGSGKGESADASRKVVELLDKQKCDFVYDGEYQMDSAIDKTTAKLKAPNGKIQGDANVLIFPNLESGNICYKAISRFGKARAIGPICQGFNKPVNDVSRAATASEIVLIIAITSLQNRL